MNYNKHFLLSVSLVVLTFITAAQNWQPINKNDHYNYSIDNTDFITNVILVDSVEIIESDSVFYLNRIMTNCDTCPNNEYHDFALKTNRNF